MSEVDFGKLLESDKIRIPQVGDVIKGRVITASKSEVKLDIDGILMGIVRGPELYYEAPEFSDLNPGDEIEATVIEEENESGLVELSFRAVGQEKAWQLLREAYRNKETIKVKITDANKGGLLARFRQIAGFLPVSQLAPDNYPRVSGGDKSRILEKLKSFIGQEMEVTVITLSESDNKIIFSEKDIWNRRQKPTLDKYQVGMVVEGKITAITNFGVFVNFDEGMEGLIHISELAWQRIDSPSELYQVGDKVKAEIVSVDGAKIFLSLKRLMTDPWLEASAKYKIGQIVPGSILKVNPFGLFVKLDEEIHGLAHVSQLGLGAKEKIGDIFKVDEVRDFEIVNISPEEHRLGLKLAGLKTVEEAPANVQKTVKEQKGKKEPEEKGETKEVKEKKPIKAKKVEKKKVEEK
ncbi:MAG: 30S ribosomal protein S1 [Patescibacteria group bacterium]